MLQPASIEVKQMKSILDPMKNDWKTNFLFWSMMVCSGIIIFMMITFVKII
jgi:hypothetical protein